MKKANTNLHIRHKFKKKMHFLICQDNISRRPESRGNWENFTVYHLQQDDLENAIKIWDQSIEGKDGEEKHKFINEKARLLYCLGYNTETIAIVEPFIKKFIENGTHINDLQGDTRTNMFHSLSIYLSAKKEKLPIKRRHLNTPPQAAPFLTQNNRKSLWELHQSLEARREIIQTQCADLLKNPIDTGICITLRQTPLDKEACREKIKQRPESINSWKELCFYHAERQDLKEAYKVLDLAFKWSLNGKTQYSSDDILIQKAELAYLYDDNDTAKEIIEDKFNLLEVIKGFDHLSPKQQESLYRITAIYQALTDTPQEEMNELFSPYLNQDKIFGIFCRYDELKTYYEALRDQETLYLGLTDPTSDCFEQNQTQHLTNSL